MPDQDAALWDAEADNFDEPADHGLRDPAVRAAWRTLLLAHLPPSPARVADLGCGTGTLTLLLTEAGHAVDGIDFSPRMVEQARTKLAGHAGATITVGDASQPPLTAGAYDVVLVRHVLWALPDPALALTRWKRLLRPRGTLLLVEGRWSNGAGLAAAQTLSLVLAAGLLPQLVALDDPSYWGRTIEDERYLVRAG